MDLNNTLNCKLCFVDCEDLIDVNNSTINNFDVAMLIQKHLWLKVCIFRCNNQCIFFKTKFFIGY